ncbi:hypothetical protein BURPS1710b_A2107 [Burkholderia pseudomallei 1710b]|uniref:Uncharacterized protein n=1 Tax=Burkholderia pseudomallei (strain 1710b) TaxID=320372 RepID=Q3JGP6_BURP1|nr:hypothetical protein BURPS1710b_A2107 [Burkholderia pseudomallei 1710b]
MGITHRRRPLAFEYRVLRVGFGVGGSARDRRHFEDAMVMALGRALRFRRSRARRAAAFRRRVVDPVQRAREPAGEHVAKLAFLARLREHERRMTQFDLRARGGRLGFDDREQAPAALRQALQVMLEHRHPGDPVLLRLLVAPVIRRLVTGAVEDVRVGVAAERLFHRRMVVREEMARHVQHRQRVGGPDAGVRIDVDRQLRLHRVTPWGKTRGALGARAASSTRRRSSSTRVSCIGSVENGLRTKHAGVQDTRLRAPDLLEHAHPVFAHDLADARRLPSRALHRGRQVREFADRSDAFRIHDLAEIREPAVAALVVREPIEEIDAVALREIGADADRVLADQVHDVADRLDVIVDRRVDPALQERREHRHPDEAARVRDLLQLRVALVARMLLETRRQAVRVAHGFLRERDRLRRRVAADVRQVDHDPDAVHLGDHLAAEIRQPAVALVAAGADEVLRVVAKLHDAHAHVGERLDIAQVVLERVRVLEAEDHARAAFPLRAEDVVRRAHERQQFAVLANLLFHQRDVVDRLSEVLPHGHRAVRGRHAALLHVFEHRAFELRNVQAIDDDAVLVQRAHGFSSLVGAWVGRRANARRSFRSGVSVDREAFAKREDLAPHALFGRVIAFRVRAQGLEHLENQPADLAELRCAEAARRARRRAEADARRDRRLLRIERNAVLVARDARALERLLDLRALQALRAQIDEQQMVVGAARHEIDAARLQHVAERLRVREHAIDVGLEIVCQRLAERHRLAGDHVHQRAALQAGEHRRVDLLRDLLVVGQHEAAARAAQRLVRRRRDDVRVFDRVRMAARGDHAGDMRHVDHQLRADRIGDRAKPREVELARIGGEAGDDEARLVLLRERLDLVVIDQHRVAAHAVLERVEPLAGQRRLRAVREVSARVERHSEHRVARLREREHHRAVRLGARVRLHVRMAGVEEPLHALDRERLDFVGEFATAVIALARIAFRILVGQHRALRIEHRARHDVLRRDQLDLRLLAFEFLEDRAAHGRVALGERLREEGIGVRHEASRH